GPGHDRPGPGADRRAGRGDRRAPAPLSPPGTASSLRTSLHRHTCPTRHGQEPPMPLVFDFDHSHRRPPMELKDLLGGKGANLAEMTSVLRLPVPHGFTISPAACRAYMAGGWPAPLSAEVKRARTRLERKMGKHLGDPVDPLLVSVRSGAKF